MSETFAAVAQLTTKGVRITATGSFTATKTGWHEVITQGPGGGSGGVRASYGTPVLRSGGGGAGEYIKMRHFLTAGTAYTVTIGAFGAAGASTPTAGGNGGSVSFAGPIFTQTSLGGNGSQAVLIGSAFDDLGAAGGRRDGQTGSGLPAVQQGPDCWGGANGGSANSLPGGWAGGFSAATSSSRAGSGGCSMFAGGGGGASSVNTSGAAGTLGSGAGGSWTNNTTGVAGAAGGPGFCEVAYIGIN